MIEPKESVLNPDGSVPDHLRSQSSRTGISSLNHGDPRIPTTPLVPFDLLFGITKVETPAIFTPMEERQGIDVKRRDRDPENACSEPVRLSPTSHLPDPHQ